MGQRLSFFHGMDVGLGLQLHNDLTIDHQVRAEAALQFHVVVDHRHGLLLLNLETALAKFVGQADS
jgi:hypothetical protein